MGATLRKTRGNGVSRGRKVLLAAALTFPGIVAAEQAPASADNCTNRSVMHVWTEQYGGDHLSIRVIPTNTARFWADRTVMNEIWQAVQQCVGGLYGNTADGVYEQIECHVAGAGLWPTLGGYSWDFETWRLPTSWDVAVRTECNWGGEPYSQL